MNNDNSSACAVKPASVESTAVEPAKARRRRTADDAPPPAEPPKDAPPAGAVPGMEQLPPPKEYVLTVRGLREPRSSPRLKRFTGICPRAVLAEALAYTGHPHPEPVIEVADPDDFAFLDIDCHGETKPDPKALNWVLNCTGLAVASWLTHGGGGRLAFVADPTLGVTAREMAAAGALAWWRATRERPEIVKHVTGVEEKGETRHPAYPRKKDGREERAGEVRTYLKLRTGPEEIGREVGWLLSSVGEFDEAAVLDQLEEDEFEQGQRYPHSRCPIDPTADDKGNCVTIGDHGIYCYRCYGKGISYRGCRLPGYVPWALYVDPSRCERRVNRLRDAVRHCAHWEHARHLVAAEIDTLPEHARRLYAVLMKLYHLPKLESDAEREATHKRINKALNTSCRLVRGAGRWLLPDCGTAEKDGAADAAVKLLPACQYVRVEQKGPDVPPTAKLELDAERYATFRGRGDLSAYGYPAVVPIRGYDFGKAKAADDEVIALIPADPPIVYKPYAKRHQWIAMLNDDYPGINVPYVKLLIGAVAFAQAGFTEGPRILVTGQSNSGKTTTVELVADMLGGVAAPVPVEMFARQPNTEKYIRGCAEKGERACFVITDEFAKYGLTGSQYADLFLRYKRRGDYHALYSGPASVRRPAPLVVADTKIPAEFLADVQLGRRFVYVDLGPNPQGPVDWRETGGDVDGWRKRDEIHRVIADELISEVADEVAGCPTFEQYAASLGFGLLRDDDAGVDADAPFRDLFRLYLHTADTRNGQLKGAGWKEIDLNAPNDPFTRAYLDCAGDGGRDTQPISGRQWGTTVGVPGLRCKLDEHGKKVGIRFWTGTSPRSADFRTGWDVLPADHPMRPGEPADVVPLSRPGVATAARHAGDTDATASN